MVGVSLTLAVVGVSLRQVALRWRADALVLEAIGLTQAGSRDEARLALDQALELWPGLAEGLYRQGELELAEGRTSAALAAFEGALERDPDHVDALLGRGRLRQVHDADAACADFSHARALASKGDPRPWLAEGLVRAHLLDDELAATLLREGLTVARLARAVDEVDYEQAVFRLGEVLLRLGRVEESIPELDEAVRLLAEEVGPRLVLARALTAQGKDPAAVEVLSSALRRDPNHLEALEQRGNALRRLGSAEDALGDLSKAIARPQARLARGLLRFETIDFLPRQGTAEFQDEGAREDLLSVVAEPALTPSQRARACVALGWLELSGERAYRSRATRWFERALQHQPHDTQALLSLGLVQASTANIDEARSALEQALPRPGGGYAARIGLARLAWDAGDLDEARRLLDEAVTLAPNRRTAYAYRYRLRQAQDETDASEDRARAIAVNREKPTPPESGWADPFLVAEYANDRGVMAFGKAFSGGMEWSWSLSRATAWLQRALLFDRFAPAAAARVAGAYYLLCEDEEAESSYERAFALDPLLMDVEVTRSAILRDLRQDYEGAEAALLRALAAGPTPPLEGQLRYELARALDDQGRMEDALVELERASLLTPTRHCVASLRARILVRLGRESEEAVRRASLLFWEGDRNQIRSKLYTLAGDWARDREKFYDSRHYFTRAIEADPRNAAAWHGRSRVTMRGSMSDMPQGFVDGFMAAELRMDYARRFLDLEARLERFRPLIGELESGLQLILSDIPDLPAVPFFIGYVAFMKGAWASAEPWFDQAYALSSQRSYISVTYRGAARMRLNRLEEARVDLERADELLHKSPISVFWRACLHMRQGQPDAALDALQDMAERGYRFPERIRDTPEFFDLREDPRLRALLRGSE